MKQVAQTSKVSYGRSSICRLLFNFEGPKWSSTGVEYGGVAQLGEHLLCKQGVIGSIPFISTTREGKGLNGRETPLTKWAHSSAG